MWFEIEKQISLFGIFRFWVAWSGCGDGESAYMYIEDAEKKLNELRFPPMKEKVLREK